ncbi:hypothetical protein ACHAXN_003655 [Cyclotella atomus]
MEEFPQHSPSTTSHQDTPMLDTSSSASLRPPSLLIAELLAHEDNDGDEQFTVEEELQKRGMQRKICEELLDILDAVDNNTADNDGSDENGSPPKGPNGTFIRTTLYTPSSLNQSCNDTTNNNVSSTNASRSIREILGIHSSSETSRLSSVFTKMLTHRVNIECLLPHTQDIEGNAEAMGLPSDNSGGVGNIKSAMTISSSGMAASRVYVSLLGQKGAWGAGLVDVCGVSAIAALMRRWCVECRGREPVVTKKAVNNGGGKKNVGPERKKMRGVRKSVRINANATFWEEDDSNSMDCDDETASPNLNATFFVAEDDSYYDDKLTESAMIYGGLALAGGLAKIAMQEEYKNWSSEAREAYLDGCCVALATISALKTSGPESFITECSSTVDSLERAICTSVKPKEFTHSHPSEMKRSKKSPKEEKATEKLRKESTIYVLRGLLPLMNLKMEVPNGQIGKIAAYETATELIVKLISLLSNENHRERRVRLSADSTVSSSATPKQGGGRKSISFAQGSSISHTPGKTPRAMLPPSLKKSITPRIRTRSAAVNQESVIHPLLSLVMGMLHKLFTSKGLERADARGRVSNVGILCLNQLPSLERGQVLKFVGEMCHSKVSSHRLLAVELIGDVLCMEWYWNDAVSRKNRMSTPYGDGMDGEESSSKLLTALQGRLMDKSPTVRMRAAMSLGEVVRYASASGGEDRVGVVDNSFDSTPRPVAGASSRVLIDELCRIGNTLVDSLRTRASTDDKATVRKASIVAWLEMLFLAHRERNQDCVVSGLDISTLCSLCNDSSVATRNAAAEALTKLVQANYDGEEYTAQASAVEMAWAHTVLPLVRDVELSCVNKSLDSFTSLVVDPIIEVGSDASDMLAKKNTQYLVAWRLLSKISLGSQEAGGSRNGTGSLQVAIQKLFINAGNESKSLAKNLLSSVYHAASVSLGLDSRSSDSFVSQNSVVEAEMFGSSIQPLRAGAWCLLDALTGCLMNVDGNKTSASNISLGQAVRASHIDSSFLALSLRKFRSLVNAPDVPSDKRASLVIASRDCLRVISKMASFVPIQDAKNCFKDLLRDLESFRMTIDLISVAVASLVALTKRVCDDSHNDVFDECEQWIKNLLFKCEHAMNSSFAAIARHHSTEHEKDNIARILFSIGELTMVGFSSEDMPVKAKHHLTTEREPVRGLVVRPSDQLLQSVKLMLPKHMPLAGGTDDALVQTSSTIRAHAFITLGKLCLRNESLAKESLNILARELHQSSESDPAVQTNALMVMGDLCVRYTNLVDKYLPFMASCLQAREKTTPEIGASTRLSVTFAETGGYNLVKKNAVLLLSSLVLQDYIKWRGLFVFRFLAAAADQDDEVACLARTAIRGPLLEKQPNLLATSFVESIFVFNSCKAHPIYAAAASNGGAGYAEIDFERGLLEGNYGYDRRHEVYQMMLDNMSDEQKLKVTSDIVKRILGGALDMRGDLGIVCRLAHNSRAKISVARADSATHVLRDAFLILSSPHIKVGRRATEEQEDEFGEGNANKNKRSANKDRLLSKISLKHLMEIVIPVLCNLKSVLEGSRSALLKDLMKYLVYIFRSFKREVTEHLANDPTLLQELEYDMRQFEKKENESILETDVVAVA